MSVKNILSKFKDITTVVFDVDGVLTDGTVLVTDDGKQLRRFNIKDGYAINRAVKEGIRVIVISAGQEPSVIKRLEYLGVQEINIAVKDKVALLREYMEKFSIQPHEMMYMGDDMPDYHAIQLAGLKTCPADASQDIIEICDYISPKNGGQGAARDVLEKVLKLRGLWPVQK